MRCRMIERNGGAALLVDLRIDSVPHAQFAGVEHAAVGKRGANFARVAHREMRRGAVWAGADEYTRIADLAAAFRVKRRVVEHDLTFLPLSQYINDGAVENQRSHETSIGQPVITQEFRLARQGDRIAQFRTELARRTCAIPLCLHGRIEARLVDGEAAFARHIGRQIKRKPVRVVQPKYGLARYHRRCELGGLGVEQRHAGGQGFGEPLLLLQQHLGCTWLTGHEFGVVATHFPHQRRHQLMEKRPSLAQLVAMSDRTPDDASQYIAAPLVRRHHTIDDQKCAGADMVGDHTQARRFQIFGRRDLRCGAYQRFEQIDVVVAVHALHDGGDALQPHARIHRGLGQRH